MLKAESWDGMKQTNRSVHFLDRLGRRGELKDDSAEILFQSFLPEALVNSSGMGRVVHSLKNKGKQRGSGDGGMEWREGGDVGDAFFFNL